MRFRRRSRAERKKAAGRTRGQRWLLRYGWMLPLAAVFVGGGILVLTYAFAAIPLPEDVDYLNSSAEVFDRHGNVIGTFTDAERRFLVDTDELLEKRPFVGEAVIAAEDRDFYEHNGVSIRGIARAAWENLTGGKIAEGGSTITQQYVKNTVLTPERTITRKVKEAVLAIKLERRYSKDEILGFYLNTIYLGRGAYGIEAAARAYFDKHADELSLKEAAFLAAIIPSPEALDPGTNPVGARQRRNQVLQEMAGEGFISQTKAARASRGKVKAIKRISGAPKTQKAAYFMEWLRRDILGPELGPRLYTGGLKIHTTLDLEMQQYAEDAVAATLTSPDEPQAAVVSMTPGGQVRAFVGGRSFENVKKARGFNYATDQGRQPGSAFKPFTLLAAIEDGVSLSSTFSGHSPMTIDECLDEGEPWDVDNYGGSSYGTLNLSQATANSVNTVYAQLIAEIGPEKVAALLEEMEFNNGREIPPDCSLSLGGSFDVTPLQLARSYAAIDAGGELPEVTPVAWIEDSEGNCLFEYVQDKDRECEIEAKDKGEQVVEENSAHVLTQALEGVVESGTAAGAVSLPRPAAGKTGTTQDNKDAWFAGYIPQLTTVVWMGYPLEPPVEKGGEPYVPLMSYCSDVNLCRPVQGIEVTGGSFPATIWNTYMTQATAEMEVVAFPIPEDLPDEVINERPPSAVPSAAPTEEGTPEPQPTETEVEVTPPPPTPAPPPPTPDPGPTIIPPSSDPTPEPDEPDP